MQTHPNYTTTLKANVSHQNPIWVHGSRVIGSQTHLWCSLDHRLVGPIHPLKNYDILKIQSPVSTMSLFSSQPQLKLFKISIYY